MKRKVMFVLGIVIMIIGVGIFLFPIITQAYNAYQQKLMMEEVKQQILSSMLEANAETESQEAAAGTDASAASSTAASEDGTAAASGQTAAETAGAGTGAASDAESSSDAETSDTSETQILANLTEGETVEETTYSSSRLSGQKCIGIITIDTIDLIYPVVEGTEDYNIGVAIGHFTDSAGIGEEGNCAMAGHNGGTYGRYFGDIKKLTVGDEVVLTNTKGEEFTYYVTESFVVEPTDVYVVGDLGVEGKYLTMVTCTEHGTKRLIVRAQCTENPTKMKGVK